MPSPLRYSLPSVKTSTRISQLKHDDASLDREERSMHRKMDRNGCLLELLFCHRGWIEFSLQHFLLFDSGKKNPEAMMQRSKNGCFPVLDRKCGRRRVHFSVERQILHAGPSRCITRDSVIWLHVPTPTRGGKVSDSALLFNRIS